MPYNQLDFEPTEAWAQRQDAEDPLRNFRAEFFLPSRPDGTPLVYLCGHSLGLEPVGVRALLEKELDNWGRLGVNAHFQGESPWYWYQDSLRDAGARLLGARRDEVVFMNSLTVNLHLLMATLYLPRDKRRCILIDEPTFPSDLYAIRSQLRHHGLDPAKCLLTVGPRPGKHVVDLEDVETILERRGEEIAVVLWSGLNFLNGAFPDLARLTAAAHRHGCLVGLDLAHAAGNVPLHMHDWDVDFAVWCNYKYLNGGPGAVGGAFVHERHAKNLALPRLAGWWGNDPDTRFRMQLEAEFIPVEGANGWQVSNPPILALVPLRASFGQFERAGMPALRAKSERLTAYLIYLLDRLPAGRFEIVTPRDPAQRGCQVSLLIHDRARDVLRSLEAASVLGDYREPNIIRAAPVPLYNTYQDVWAFANALSRV